MSRPNLYLVLALVWIALGTGLLVGYSGTRHEWLAWVALAMSVYNAGRWWLLRSAARERAGEWASPRRRSRFAEPEQTPFKLEDEPLPQTPGQPEAPGKPQTPDPSNANPPATGEAGRPQ